MRTRAEIAEIVRGLNPTDKAACDALDEALHERARALAKQPAKEMEWLLAWALANSQASLRLLNQACIDDVCRADRIRNEMVAVGVRFDEPSELRGPEFSRVVERRAQAASAQETLRRVLTAYEVMAVDVID